MDEIKRLELKAFLIKLGVPPYLLDEAVAYLERRIKEVSQETVSRYVVRLDPP